MLHPTRALSKSVFAPKHKTCVFLEIVFAPKSYDLSELHTSQSSSNGFDD